MKQAENKQISTTETVSAMSELTHLGDTTTVCGGSKYLGTIDNGIFELLGSSQNRFAVWRQYHQKHGQWPQGLSEFVSMNADGLAQKHPFNQHFFTLFK